MSKPPGGGGPRSRLRGVLFDSGDVVVRPTSPNDDAPATEAWRRWFGGPRFVATIHAYRPGLRLDGADQAFDAGMRYLDDRHRQPLHTVAEEQERFTDFYRIVLERLGIHDPPPALLQRLVEGGDDEVAMEPFPEVVGVLQRLRDRGLRLGVLTENWPSVEIAYHRLGLRPLLTPSSSHPRRAASRTTRNCSRSLRAAWACPPRRCCSSMTGPPMSRPPLGSASRVPSWIATRWHPPFPGSPT
jgi:FMN phosphatase YigB (HAD superfamily)